MKRLVSVLLLSALVLMGCGAEKEERDPVEPASPVIPDKEIGMASDEEVQGDDSATSSKAKEDKGVSPAHAESKDGKERKSAPSSSHSTSQPSRSHLSSLEAASNEYEYARVWAQLGGHEGLDALYVTELKTGEPMNPNDESSPLYPETLTQLTGSRLADGFITYKATGKDSILVYKIPARWDGQVPAGEDFYLELLAEAEPVVLKQGDQKVLEELVSRIKK